MNRMPLPRFAFATAIAAAIGFSIHVYYGEVILDEYIQLAAQAGRLDSVITEPYPAHIVALAFLTALVPYIFKVLVFHTAGHLIPARTVIGRGLLYGLIMLGLSHALVRMPLMNLAVGNPVDVTIFMSAEVWLIEILGGIAIAWIVPLRNGKDQ